MSATHNVHLKSVPVVFLVLLLAVAVGCSQGAGDPKPDSGSLADAAVSPADTGAPGQDTAAEDTAPAEPGTPETDKANRLGDLDLAVITTAQLAASFEPLVEWKRQKGIPARVFTTEDLDRDFQGADLQEKLQAFIRKSHKELGTSWFLLGGDSTNLPPRQVWCEAYNSGEDVSLAAQVATDLYFSDLNSDWDKNGNGIPGEPGDGLDMMPELFVGRIPARTPQEVERYITKLLAYEKTPDKAYLNRILFLGMFASYFQGQALCSTLALDNAIQPLFPEWFQILKLYGEECGSFDDAEAASSEAQVAALNQGVNVTLNYGHGNVETLGFVSDDDVYQLSNPLRPSIYLTTECNSCEFDSDRMDHSGCEKFIIGQGGGVAYVGNTDFGVGVPWLMVYYREFIKLFLEQPDLTIGEVFTNTLNTYADPASLKDPLSDLRWTQFVAILMGDPTLKIWTQPLKDCSAALEQGPGGLTVTVTGDGALLQDALVTIYAPERFLFSAKTSASGVATFDFQGSTKPLGEVLLTVTHPTCVPFQEPMGSR